jgi:hypothetical protein
VLPDLIQVHCIHHEAFDPAGLGHELLG